MFPPTHLITLCECLLGLGELGDHAAQFKKQTTIRLDEVSIAYFKGISQCKKSPSLLLVTKKLHINSALYFWCFTVFAPTDEAFAKIPKADLEALLKDKAKLTAVLTYHVVAGKVMAADVKAGKVKTVQGSEKTVSTTSGVSINNA